MGVRAGVVVTRRCQGCGACLLTCPVHAIRPGDAEPVRSPDGGGYGASLVVLPSLCTGCGECIEICPVDAIDELGATCENPDRRTE